MTAVFVVVVLAGLLVWREVSARRALATLRRRLADAEAEVRKREGLINMGELVSGLAQDLKSPLQGVIGNTEVMLAGSRTEAESEELREIRENVTRAAGIVRNLLAYTETGLLDRRWHDVNDIVARVVDLCRSDLDAAGVTLRVERSERVPLVYVDGRQLEKVIATLLGGMARLTRAAEREPSALTLATMREVEPYERIAIELADRSVLVDDQESWPANLGLAACRRVIEAHGGSMSVEAGHQAGFRCRMDLPVSAMSGDMVAAQQEYSEHE